MTEHASMPVFDDERGRLIPIEFSELPFVPTRCFVVTAPGRPAERGGHEAGCRQVLVLLRGSARVRLVTAGEVTHHHLRKAGSSALIEASDHISYFLESADSEVLVLAEHPFRARPA